MVTCVILNRFCKEENLKRCDMPMKKKRVTEKKGKEYLIRHLQCTDKNFKQKREQIQDRIKKIIMICN